MRTNYTKTKGFGARSRGKTAARNSHTLESLKQRLSLGAHLLDRALGSHTRASPADCHGRASQPRHLNSRLRPRDGTRRKKREGLPVSSAPAPRRDSPSGAGPGREPLHPAERSSGQGGRHRGARRRLRRRGRAPQGASPSSHSASGYRRSLPPRPRRRRRPQAGPGPGRGRRGRPEEETPAFRPRAGAAATSPREDGLPVRARVAER